MPVGLFGLIFLALFVLKLAGPMASASWWLVTLPLWGPLLFWVLAFLATVSAVVLWKRR